MVEMGIGNTTHPSYLARCWNRSAHYSLQVSKQFIYTTIHMQQSANIWGLGSTWLFVNKLQFHHRNCWSVDNRKVDSQKVADTGNNRTYHF